MIISMISPQPHIVEQAKALTAYDPEDKFDEFIDAPGPKSSIYYPAQQIPTFLYNENYIHDLEKEYYTASRKIIMPTKTFFKTYRDMLDNASIAVTPKYDLYKNFTTPEESFKACATNQLKLPTFIGKGAGKIIPEYDISEEDEVNAAFLEGFNSE